jgi:uncharacterized protein (DUF488 family)
MTKHYTIGITAKSAEQFFALLEQNGVKKIIDTRIRPNSQLAGFAKGPDLAFFAHRLAGIDYEHVLDFAPTKELLDQYRKKQLSWAAYAAAYRQLLADRAVGDMVDSKGLHQACLLCSEHTPEQCHRRLLAEYLQTIDPAIEIIHLL